jgi:ABC-type uncharacterized transport system fused permease/ATPase subunit
MRIKTIIIIVITILLTVVIMQNSQKVKFTVLFSDFYISNLLMLLVVAIAAFILGWLVGRPKKPIKLGSDDSGSDLNKNDHNTLSSEDREYIK